MTSVSQPAPPRFVLVTTYGEEPTELIGTNATIIIKTVSDVSSGTATSAGNLGSWKNFDEAVFQFTKDVKATETWLGTYESVLRRIDQHSSAVASKSLFTDRISQYLNAEQDVFQSISELAVKLLSQSYDSTFEVEFSGAAENEEEDEIEATIGAHYLEKLRYEAVLNETLILNHFEKSDSYIDPAGGLVVDYFRNGDRITLVFSDESVQILTHVGGEFLDKVFSPAQTSRIAVRDFLDGLLLGTR